MNERHHSLAAESSLMLQTRTTAGVVSANGTSRPGIGSRPSQDGAPSTAGVASPPPSLQRAQTELEDTRGLGYAAPEAPALPQPRSLSVIETVSALSCKAFRTISARQRGMFQDFHLGW